MKSIITFIFTFILISCRKKRFIQELQLSFKNATINGQPKPVMINIHENRNLFQVYFGETNLKSPLHRVDLDYHHTNNDYKLSLNLFNNRTENYDITFNNDIGITHKINQFKRVILTNKIKNLNLLIKALEENKSGYSSFTTNKIEQGVVNGSNCTDYKIIYLTNEINKLLNEINNIKE